MRRERFTVTIEKVTRETHVVVLEGDSLMEAFDEARQLVEKRNEKQKNGKYFVTKIESEERETK